MNNKYIIITGDNEALFFVVQDAKAAVQEYAQYRLTEAQARVFPEAVASMDLEATVDVFNNVCYRLDHRIRMIVGGYQTLFWEREREKR